MPFITKYGSIWDTLPETSGRKLFVAPANSYSLEGRTYSASDDEDGLSPERALRTVNRAWALASAGDNIVLLPGAHLAQTSVNRTTDSGTATSVAANVANVTMMGMPGNRLYPKTSLSIAANDETVNVTAAGIEIANIAFITDALNTASANLNFSAAASRLYIHDCIVDVTAATANTGILGFDAIGAAAYVLIERCRFVIDGAFGAAVDMTATVDSVLDSCDVVVQTGTLAAGITTGAATDRCYIRRCSFMDGAGTITAGIDGTGATIANGVIIHDCRFGTGVTVPIDNFDAAEAQISENYDFGVGATDGGVLIVAIT